MEQFTPLIISQPQQELKPFIILMNQLLLVLLPLLKLLLLKEVPTQTVKAQQPLKTQVAYPLPMFMRPPLIMELKPLLHGPPLTLMEFQLPPKLLTLLLDHTLFIRALQPTQVETLSLMIPLHNQE